MHTLLQEFGLPCLESHQAHCYWRSQQSSQWYKSMLYRDTALLGQGEMKPDSTCESLHFGYISKPKTAYWHENQTGLSYVGSFLHSRLPLPPTEQTQLNSLKYGVSYFHLNRCSHSKCEADPLVSCPLISYCHRCSLFP